MRGAPAGVHRPQTKGCSPDAGPGCLLLDLNEGHVEGGRGDVKRRDGGRERAHDKTFLEQNTTTCCPANRAPNCEPGSRRSPFDATRETFAWNVRATIGCKPANVFWSFLSFSNSQIVCGAADRRGFVRQSALDRRSAAKERRQAVGKTLFSLPMNLLKAGALYSPSLSPRESEGSPQLCPPRALHMCDGRPPTDACSSVYLIRSGL